ncbi:hypothetical protein [Moritella viscosa]|uniref:Uncharacterized protein n=1 Tax=Moritella viscosa TaxID=80854 RepID=A0ABY1HBG2_9GAMM|nr:hypothetical protein [Moritella viscosa]SGY84098.1 Putative uncharacterized protein [Moritella viscosa]SGY85911.1 Putative uncharacterized protein [Moritella viscosa]SHO24538.1 Putative uncharacterized protein [Moritella viscosa]
MNDEELNEICKILANNSFALSKPIDLDGLVEQGVLKLVGKSYYVRNIKAMPDEVRRKIKSVSSGKHGVKVTFIKETKSMSKLSKEFKKFRD